MDTSAESNKSIKLRAVGLIQRTVILAVLGIVSIILCIILFSSNPSIIFVVIFFVSIALVWFCVPILGINAIIYIIKSWTAITGYADKEEEKQISKISGNLLIAVFLFAVISLFPQIFIGIFGDGTVLRFLWSPVIVIAASVMGGISFKLYHKISGFLLGRIASAFSVILCLAVMVFVFLPSSYLGYLVQQYKYLKKAETFSGNSDSLKQTIIVPTLDSPYSGGKNVIWCSSFQIAWNELRDNIVKEPIVLPEAQELADLLNKSTESRYDLDESSYFVAAGLVMNGIEKYIKSEMSRRFHREPVPEFQNLGPLDLVIYAFLTAQAKFEHPYKDLERGISFKDSNDIVSKVAAFGVWEDKERYKKQREQIDILYQSPLPESNSLSADPAKYYTQRRSLFSEMEEFALDLCRHTQPYQIVLAKIEPKPTLALALVDLQAKISDFTKRQDYEELKAFNEGDKLFVPEMYWKINHEFVELVGKFISNPRFSPYLIKEADQMIQFRLDRYGAVLKSEAKLLVTFGGAPIGRNFRFDGPFLIYMKKRDCEQPFFVMWIDNAELLTKK